MAVGSVVAVAVAFILLGILNLVYASGSTGLNWIISGVVALLAGWGATKMMK